MNRPLVNQLNRSLMMICLGVSILSLTGCEVGAAIGLGGRALGASGKSVKPAYAGLKGQKVGVVVWADTVVRLDFPNVQPDLAKGIQQKILEAAADKGDEVQEVKWLEADDILRFQQAHPEFETDSAGDMAARLPGDATRIIYVEVTGLSLHPNEAVDLTRGVMTVSLKVVELGSGKPKVVPLTSKLTAAFPKDAPAEGLLTNDTNDTDVYQHTLNVMTTKITQQFVTHDEGAE